MQKFDEAAYREFAGALRERVAAHAPEWTDHNESDPGVTLLELFAFLAESLLYRADTLPARGRSMATRLMQSASALAGAGTATGAIERPRYFTGQVLGVDDLTLEQDYFRTRLRRLNRALHGFGIVHGLSVSVERKQAREHVVIAPGFAIDAAGEEIEVPGPTTACLPQTGRILHVILDRTERPTRPQPAPRSGQEEFGRIEESFAIRVDEAAATGDGIVLARLRRAGEGWRVDRAFKPARAAKA